MRVSPIHTFSRGRRGRSVTLPVGGAQVTADERVATESRLGRAADSSAPRPQRVQSHVHAEAPEPRGRSNGRRLERLKGYLCRIYDVLTYRIAWRQDEAFAYLLLETARIECEQLLRERSGRRRGMLARAHREIGMAGYLVSERLDSRRRNSLLEGAHIRSHARAWRRDRRPLAVIRGTRRARVVLDRACSHPRAGALAPCALQRTLNAARALEMLPQAGACAAQSGL